MFSTKLEYDDLMVIGVDSKEDNIIMTSLIKEKESCEREMKVLRYIVMIFSLLSIPLRNASVKVFLESQKICNSHIINYCNYEG